MAFLAKTSLYEGPILQGGYLPQQNASVTLACNPSLTAKNNKHEFLKFT